jgi:hypothetical protein
MHARPFISAAILLALAGCRLAAPSAEPITMMALDTSGSAIASHEAMFKRAAEMIQELPDGQPLYLYRFDSSPAEVYSQTPPGAFDEISTELNTVLKHRSATKGTNLAKLFAAMNQRIATLGVPVKIVVFTDCGTEEMGPNEIRQTKQITSDWERDSMVTSVQLIGVGDSYREQLRKMIMLDPKKLEILKLE